LKSVGFIRGTGAMLIVLGTPLVASMAAIMIWMLSIMQESGKPGSGARFTGTKNEAIARLGVLGAVFIFGAMAIVNGLWQVIFGRRNLFLVYLMLGLAIVLYVGGYIVLGVFDR
jgi:hypothetical protein